MSRPDDDSLGPVVLAAGPSAARWAEALRAAYGAALSVVAVGDAAALREHAAEFAGLRRRLPLVLADLDGGPEMREALPAIHAMPEHANTRLVAASSAGFDPDTLVPLLNRGAIHGFLHLPCPDEAFLATTYTALRAYLLGRMPGIFVRLSETPDPAALSAAYEAAESQRWSVDRQVRSLKSSFFTNRGQSDEALEEAMVEELDRALGNPPRQKLTAGTLLLQEGQDVDRIWVMLSGKVQLFRSIDERDVIFHAQTVGRIVGLMSLSYRRKSFFSCRAETDITVIPVPFADLDGALQTNPVLNVRFVAVLLRSLARRARRSIELQIEINSLNQTLSRERDQLTETLNQLERAQTRLVENEKMATLGQLAAGVAHELNNPVAAIERASHFMVEDVAGIVGRHPDGRILAPIVESAMTSKPLSTRDERRLRGDMAKALGDDRLARRLVRVGIHSPAEYHRVIDSFSATDPDVCLHQIEHYHKLGSSLKNIMACAERITALVKSLRSYARASKEVTPDVDIRIGLDETLLLFGHELKNVEVIRQYGEVPPIECHPGEINQVWTNLISNAIEAMNGRGRLRIETRKADRGHVEARITDSGGGIRPENLDRIFDVNFTTRQGPAAFGLGIGLPICREIVQRHGGTLTVSSEPGRTTFYVVLPVRQRRTGPESGAEDGGE